MNVNDIVEFKKTKNRYRVAGFGRMKVPGQKGWLDSVVYENFQDYDEILGYVAPKEIKIYTREKEDFEAKFEPSIPKVQVFNTQDGRMIYDFGLPENVLARYFDEGYGLAGSLTISDEAKKNLPMFCQGLAGDILIGSMKTADDRISQKLLDAIKKDIKSGVFAKNAQGMAEIQNLLYFLCIPDDSEKKNEEEAPKIEEVPEEESQPLDNVAEILDDQKEEPEVDDQEEVEKEEDDDDQE